MSIAIMEFLDELAQELRSYMERHPECLSQVLRRPEGGKGMDEHRDKRGDGISCLMDRDLSNLLWLSTKVIPSVFGNSPQRRNLLNYIHELRSIRNVWYHRNGHPVSAEDCYRHLDTVRRALLALEGDPELVSRVSEVLYGPCLAALCIEKGKETSAA